MEEIQVFLLVSLLHGLPAFLVIFIIYYISKKFGYKKFARKWKRTFVFALLIYLPGLTFYSWWGSHKYFNFQLNEKYKVKVTTKSCQICFLDGYEDFTIKINNLKTDKNYKFEFSNDGIEVDFKIKNDNQDLILIETFIHQYSNVYYLIDLQQNKIKILSPSDSLLFNQFTTVYKIKQNAQLKKIN